MKDSRIFLQHIIESIEVIEGYAKGLSKRSFLDDQEKQDAIMRRLEIIGEAVKNLPEEFKEEHSDIPWHKAMGTRNILIHHYFGIELGIVWDTIKKSLPEFRKQIEELLSSKN